MNRMQKKGLLNINKSYPAESLQMKLARIMETGVGIEKISQNPMEYSEEYDPGSDIRTDRFDVALEAKMASQRNDRKQAYLKAKNEQDTALAAEAAKAAEATKQTGKQTVTE